MGLHSQMHTQQSSPNQKPLQKKYIVNHGLQISEPFRLGGMSYQEHQKPFKHMVKISAQAVCNIWAVQLSFPQMNGT